MGVVLGLRKNHEIVCTVFIIFSMASEENVLNLMNISLFSILVLHLAKLDKFD